MRYYTRTKNSVRYASDEEEYKLAISETVNKLSMAYETKMVGEFFITAAEFYLDLHLSPAERKLQIKEISEVFNEELKKALHKK